MKHVDVTISERGLAILLDGSRSRSEIGARLLRLGCQVYCDEELSPPARLSAIATDLAEMFGVQSDVAIEWLLDALEAQPLGCTEMAAALRAVADVLEGS